MSKFTIINSAVILLYITDDKKKVFGSGKNDFQQRTVSHSLTTRNLQNIFGL